jgi:hypothetical protein
MSSRPRLLIWTIVNIDLSANERQTERPFRRREKHILLPNGYMLILSATVPTHTSLLIGERKFVRVLDVADEPANFRGVC